jgi:hypothetical protein
MRNSDQTAAPQDLDPEINAEPIVSPWDYRQHRTHCTERRAERYIGHQMLRMSLRCLNNLFGRNVIAVALGANILTKKKVLDRDAPIHLDG